MSKETYTHMVPTPARTSMNSGLSPAKVSTLVSIFGNFPNLTDNCATPKNAKVKALLQTRDVGPFRATGVRPALSSLESVFDAVKAGHPELYALLKTEGMMCYRRVRGGTTPSNHAAGTAIDLNIAGILPDFNAKMIPNGFVILYGYFHRAGWFWAAGYSGRTDPMHFEVADETLKLWKKQGQF